MTLLHWAEFWQDWEHAARSSSVPDPLVRYPLFATSHALPTKITAVDLVAAAAVVVPDPSVVVRPLVVGGALVVRGALVVGADVVLAAALVAGCLLGLNVVVLPITPSALLHMLTFTFVHRPLTRV